MPHGRYDSDEGDMYPPRRARPGEDRWAGEAGRRPPGMPRQQPGRARPGGRGRASAQSAQLAHRNWLGGAGYVLATFVAVIAVVVALVGYGAYRRLDGNITVVKVHGLSGRTVYGALNVLVLGSQMRAGQHGHFGVAAGSSPLTSNSDNLLLVHLNPTHTRAVILSIPRDLFVYEPGCQARNRYIGIGIQGPYSYPPGNIIDGALNIGGPTCAVSTVEDLTGIKLDHFAEFDFNSFRTMVDALGGVEVCVPRGGYHDPKSHLNLSRGLHLLKYNAALAYVRTRDALGGPDAGGDLPRIQLQQAFISSIVQKVNKEGLFSNIPQLLSIADTATKALTVDSGLGSVDALLTLARSLVHLKSRDVTLLTLPTTMDTYNYPTYSQHLMAVQPQDDVLYQMIRTGQQWTGQLPVQPYNKVSVRVLNGTGQTGLAALTARRLRRLGFNVVGTGNAAYTSTTTVDFAGLDQADGAYTLMTALNSFPAGQNTLAEPAGQVGMPGTVTLTLGTDFAGVNPPAVTHRSGHGRNARRRGRPRVSLAVRNGPGAVQSRNAAASICSGLPPAYNPGANG